MIKKCRLLFPLLYCLTVNAQRPPETYNIGSRFNASCQQEFQEKVYLHTDKSHYISGEHIRFRAFRTEAASHLPTLYSRFIYVELYNPKEELVGQLKVMEKEGVFHGTLPLDKYLPSGTYKLRAFTYWMQNFDEQFYFHKNIEIENTQWPDLQRQTQWVETESRDKILYFRFITKQNTYFPGTFLDCRMYKGQKEIRKDIVRTNSNGWGKFTLRKKDSITTLKIQFLNKKPVEYQTFFRVPQLTDTVDADVQFFPEGGYLLAGIRSQINLKAVGTDGFGIDIYGCIYGKTTGMVTPFASSHRGMGRFTFEAKEGEEYYAMVKMPDGTEKKVELPQVKTTGIILHAEVSDSVIRYSCPATPEFHAEKKLYVLVHCRGKLIAINRAGPFWNGILPVKELPPGIVQGVLIDEDGKIYSSRMSFIFPEEKQNLTIQTGKQKHHKRDCVLLSVSFIGKDTLSCSVAVTDSLLAPEKRWDKNIVNYFLLSSDLKGQVETPGWYFDRTIPFPYRKRMMDIMLATQGWQRFDVEKATQGIGKPMPFFLELSQAISGVIRNYWGKKAKNPKLFAIAPQLNLLKQVEVDSNSRFLLNVQFPEKTTFIFQALTAKNSKWVELFIDNDSLRPPQNPLFPEKIILTDTSQEKKSFPTEQEFSKVPTTGVYYNEGRKIYMLREAEVVRRNDSTYLGNFEHIAEQILEARDIREENIHSLEEWIRKIPGAWIKKDSAARHRILYTRLQKIPASVFVNDLDITKVFAGEDIPNLLNAIPIENIERIGYVKDRLQATTLDIYIYLKPGCSFYPGSCRLDFIQCTPLGYHTPVEFYHPKYEIAEERDNPEPDERSTLYWNPAVRLIPGDREKELYFYTSDTGGPYRIVIEGMTNRGEAVRKVKIIR